MNAFLSSNESTERLFNDGISCVRTHLKNHLKPGALESWLCDRAPCEFEPFYSSIDIRDAGFKIAPVDANLFPAGFNNICEDDLKNSEIILRPLLERHLGRLPKKMAIVPELHTKNQFYADNLYELRQIFRNLGIDVEIGWLDETKSRTDVIELATTDGRTLRAFPFWREGHRLTFAPFEPEFILVNNDFSSGFPRLLDSITQPIEPSIRMGWHTRKKSDFFAHYNTLAQELAQRVGLDPWRLQVTTELVREINFDTGEGMDRVAAAVDRVLENVRAAYAARGIKEQPFAFVKNNAGTYGMGILRVESGRELLELNRREKNKMAVGKNAFHVHEVIVQEGIPTRFQLDGIFAEPAVYLLGHELLGGFLRKNPNRGKVDNLNSRGMIFQRLCISDLRFGVDRDLELELVYGTIAQLSAAAMTLEIAQVERGGHRSANA